jgi:hypothetical protein
MDDGLAGLSDHLQATMTRQDCAAYRLARAAIDGKLSIPIHTQERCGNDKPDP